MVLAVLHVEDEEQAEGDERGDEREELLIKDEEGIDIVVDFNITTIFRFSNVVKFELFSGAQDKRPDVTLAIWLQTR